MGVVLAVVALAIGPFGRSFGEEVNVSMRPAIAVSPDGKIVAVSWADDFLLPRNEWQAPAAAVRLIDAASGRELRRISLPGREFDVFRDLEFTPDGTMLAAGGRGQVQLFDVQTGKRVALLRGTRAPYHSISLSPDGRWLAGADTDKEAMLWSMKLPDAPEPVAVGKPLSKPDVLISSVAFWPVRTGAETDLSTVDTSLSHVLATTPGRQLRFWSPQSGEELAEYRQSFDRDLRHVAWSPEGTLLAVCGDGFVSLRHGMIRGNVSPASEIRRIPHPVDQQVPFFQVEFAPDGRSFAASDASTIRVWETGLDEKQSGKLLATIQVVSLESSERPSMGIPLHSFAYFPDRQRIAVMNLVGELAVYDRLTGKKLEWPLAAAVSDSPTPSDASAAHSPPQPRDRYLLSQIGGLLKEADALHLQGRMEEAREHREKAAYRAQQLAELLRQPWAPDAVGKNLITNGSFEVRATGQPPRNIETLQPESEAIAGWRTFDPQPRRDNSQREQDSEHRPLIVDWIGPERWKASHGDYCLDIDGGIRQSISTEIGRTYALKFDFAGNPEAGETIEQTLQVETFGDKHEFHFDATGGATSDLKWATQMVVFTAKENSTNVRFVNVRPNVHSAGVALDHVSAEQLDPAVAAAAHDLFERSRRFGREAAGLYASGRLEEARQHAKAAAGYRKQLLDLTSRSDK
jgi:WD40 repeat protein